MLPQLGLLLVLFVSIQSKCNKESCSQAEATLQELVESSKPSVVKEFGDGKQLSKELRRASFRWGKRSDPEREIKASSRFWGKRMAPASELRRASIRWGKRSEPNAELFPGGIFLPVPFPYSAEMKPEESDDELMLRVAKAEDLRPKLAISSRLWGR